MTITVWECPKCGSRQRERLAKEVFHNCTKAKKVVSFKKIETEE